MNASSHDCIPCASCRVCPAHPPVTGTRICDTDMSAGALSALVESFQTVNPVGFLMVVNKPVFPPQLNMNTRATIPRCVWDSDDISCSINNWRSLFNFLR